MRFKAWWRNKSGRSRAVTILATIMILQIGLCFSTPEALSWCRTLFHLKPSDDPFEAIGMMAFQAMLFVLTGLVLILISIFWHPGLTSPKPKRKNHD